MFHEDADDRQMENVNKVMTHRGSKKLVINKVVIFLLSLFSFLIQNQDVALCPLPLLYYASLTHKHMHDRARLWKHYKFKSSPVYAQFNVYSIIRKKQLTRYSECIFIEKSCSITRSQPIFMKNEILLMCVNT